MISRKIIGYLRGVGILLAVVMATFGPVTGAFAHPLGNFTVNRYSRIEVSANDLQVRYVVDQAEVPAFQRMSELHANQLGSAGDVEEAAFLNGRLDIVQSNVTLVVSGRRLPLQA